jgi:hypothetical protein
LVVYITKINLTVILQSTLRLPRGLFSAGVSSLICTYHLSNACYSSVRLYLLTHSMEQSSSWEANRLSASQVIPRILWNPEEHYRHLSLSWAGSIQSIPPHPTSWRVILILSYYLRLGLPSVIFTSGFPTNTLYTPLLSPYVLHASPISFFSILSPEQYWVRSIGHYAPHYVVFSRTYVHIMSNLVRAEALHMYHQASYGCLKNYNHDLCFSRIFVGWPNQERDGRGYGARMEAEDIYWVFWWRNWVNPQYLSIKKRKIELLVAWWWDRYIFQKSLSNYQLMSCNNPEQRRPVSVNMWSWSRNIS